MAAPIVTYWNSGNSTNITSTGWKIGEIDAGATSTHFTFNIWNNKGGTSETSTMKDVTLSILDSSGGTTGVACVKDKWFRAKINGGSELTLGGGTTTPLYAKGLSSSSTSINGTTGDSTKNYATVEAWVVVPQNAAEGVQNFIVRTSYKYT